MARRPTRPTPQRPTHTVEEKKSDIEQLKRRISELEAFDPAVVKKRFSSPEVTQLQTAIDHTLSAVFGHGTVEYDRYSLATRLDHGPVIMQLGPQFGGRGYDDGGEARQYIAEGKAQATSLLQQAVRSLGEEIELGTPASSEAPPARSLLPASRKVFVVHGRDNDAKNEVALFLSKIGLEEIILHARPNIGRHLLTKFQEESEGASFAVVLITPDDEGGLPGEPSRKRARQNVVFELGFFIGKLGAGRVAALVKGDVEKPSDFDGVGYIPLDPAGGWKGLLARELKAAKIPFDGDKVFEA